jgi:hypothetical protein
VSGMNSFAVPDVRALRPQSKKRQGARFSGLDKVKPPPAEADGGDEWDDEPFVTRPR